MSEQTITDNILDVDFPAVEGDEAPEYFTILKVWQEMLKSAEKAATRRVYADWAAVIVGKWPFIQFSDLQDVHNEYFRLIDELRKIFDLAIEADPEALNYTTPTEDIEHNSEMYFHILTEWNKALIVAQHEWRADDPKAAAKMVALGEVHAQILGKEGMAAYLGYVGMPFTEEDQATLTEHLQAFRDELTEEDE